MLRLRLLSLLFLSCSLHLSAQEKLVLAGSGNPAVMIVDKQSGAVEWKHALEKGEECNTVAVTRQGNILYSYKKGAKLIGTDHRVIWDYKAPEGTELQSATLLKDGGFLLGICGNPARLIELDKNGKERNRVEIDLQIEKPHGQFRQVFQLRNKNYLLPVMGKQKMMEINRKGAVVAEFPTGGRAFSSLELRDGNILLPCGDGHFFQVIDRKTGKELKRVTSEDVQGASLLFVGQILDAGKGNLLICNWYGHTKDATVDEPQLIEVDANGKVLWSLNDKENIGKVSAACLVSNPKFKINVVE